MGVLEELFSLYFLHLYIIASTKTKLSAEKQEKNQSQGTRIAWLICVQKEGKDERKKENGGNLRLLFSFVLFAQLSGKTEHSFHQNQTAHFTGQI